MKRLRIGRPRSALVVAPHPDDETIGAYGLIRSLRERGCRVRILVVSDGAGSHRASARWPERRLVAQRRRETLGAMRTLGVPAGDVEFLALPDGALGVHARHGTVIRRALDHLARTDLVIAPVAEDAHPDHRFVAAVVALARLPRARRLGYLVWTSGTAHVGAARGHLLGDGGAAKRATIRRYRTQTGLIRDDPEGFAIAPHELRAFARPAERYWEGRRCGRSR